MDESGFTLGDKLKKIRKLSSLGSLDEAAQKLGVAKRTLGNYERGETLPDIDFLARLAALSGEDLAALVQLRLAAAGHPNQIQGVSDEPGKYTARSSAPASVMRSLKLSSVPEEWAVVLVQLVLAGQLSESGAKTIIQFFDNWQPSQEWLQHMEAEGDAGT